MSTNFPTSKDTLTNPTSEDYTATVDHAAQHTDANDAIQAMQDKVGIDSSADSGSIDYKLTNTAQVDPGHKHTYAYIQDFATGVGAVGVVASNTAHAADVTTNPHAVTIDQVTPTTTKGDLIVEDGTNAVRLPVGTDDYVLSADSTDPNGVAWKPAGAGDMVSSVYDPQGVGGDAFIQTGTKRQLARNGNLDVWQRGTSFTNAVNTAYTADGWKIGRSDDAVVDVDKSSLVPTLSESGSNSNSSLKFTVTTADTSIATGQFYTFLQLIEGYDVANYGFGQSGGGFITLSFWARATKTGIYSVYFRNADGLRTYIAEYTVNTTNTWEKKIITVPVDDGGTWDYITGVGLRVGFALAAGATVSTTAGSWQAGAYLASVNQVNALDAISNTFNIAQVQVNAGSVALPFQPKSYGEELAKCERYYQLTRYGSRQWMSAGGQIHGNDHGFKTTMRISPTLAVVSAGSTTNATVVLSTADINGFRLSCTSATGGDSFTINATASADAEL